MLLHIDGFNAIADYSNSDQPGKWAAGSVGSTTTDNPRNGARCLTGSGPSRLITKTFSPAPSGDARCGVAQYIPATYQTGNILEIREGTTIHLAVALDGTGHLVVKRGATVLETSTEVVGLAAYFYVELGGTIHDSAGSYDVRLNGVSIMSDSGIDTQNGGTGVWDNAAVAFGGHDNGGRMDDWYLCDTSGAKNNDFLGAVRVLTVLPVTDAVAAGSNADFTPSTGTDHGALVDELTPNTTDYNTGINNGDYDTYELGSIAAGGDDILGIQVNFFVQKTDVAARTCANVIVSGASGNVDLATQSPTTSWGFQWDVVEDDPDVAGDWTESAVNALEAGLKIVA